MTRRVKKKIVVAIAVMKEDDRSLVINAVDEACQYADEVCVWASGSYQYMPGRLGLREEVRAAGADFINVGPDLTSRYFRSQAFRVMRKNQPDEGVCIMFLEVGQRVSDLAVVRSTIEFNAGKIVTAIRRFQWDGDHYRVDGPYASQRIPVVAYAAPDSEWSHGFSTAPDWMWRETHLWVEAPFDIIDVTFMLPDYRWDDGDPVLEAIPGRVFL